MEKFTTETVLKDNIQLESGSHMLMSTHSEWGLQADAMRSPPERPVWHTRRRDKENLGLPEAKIVILQESSNVALLLLTCPQNEGPY